MLKSSVFFCFFTYLFLRSVCSYASPQSQEVSPPIASFSSEVLSPYPTTEILYSDETIFSSTRSLKKLSHVTSNVTVITREELDKWPVSDLDEALGFVNGLVVQDDGHLGQTATVQIHGSKEREVRVLIDGITMNITTAGGLADLSQIPIDIVEKIEILKGPSSSVWGSSLGGVINIITRPHGATKLPSILGETSFGEFGTFRQRGEASGSLDVFNYYAMGSYVESDGFRAHGSTLEKRGFLKSEIPLGEGLNFQGTFGYSGSKVQEFEFPATPQVAVATRFARKVYSRYGSAGLTWQPSENLYLEAMYKISERSFKRDFDLLPAGSFFRLTKTRSLIHEVSLQSITQLSDAQVLVSGIDVGVDVFNAASFQTGGTTRFNENNKNTRHAYYSNYQLNWKALDVDLGARIDAQNSFGTQLSPNAGLSYQLPFAHSRLRGTVSRGFNTPSLVDRFVSVGTTVANPDLRPETAVAYNLGLETNPWAWLFAKATFFQTHLKNAIQTIRRSDGISQPVNQDRERRTGVEAELKLGPWKGLSGSYGATYVKAVTPGQGPVQNRPRFTQDVKLNQLLEWKDFRLNFNLAGRYTDLVTYLGFTDPIDKVFVFDAKVLLAFPAFKYGQLSLFVQCDNLFNQDFSFDGSRDPLAERNYETGLKYKVLEF